MLETLADHDDELMEQLLEDIQPPRDKVFDDLAKELRDGLVCPVLIGAATRTNGVLRLLKALRHEAPGVAETAQAPRRRSRQRGGRARCSRPSTPRTAARCRSRACSPGQVGDGTTLHTPDGEAGRVSARVQGHGPALRQARAGVGRRDGRASASSTTPRPATRSPPASRRIPRWSRSKPYAPVLAIAVQAKERKDDVKLGAAFTKLTEEDPSLTSCTIPKPTRW